MFPNGTVSLTSFKCVDVMFRSLFCLIALQNNSPPDTWCQPFVIYKLKTLHVRNVRRQIWHWNFSGVANIKIILLYINTDSRILHQWFCFKEKCCSCFEGLLLIDVLKCVTRALLSNPLSGERGGSVVECRTPEREVRGSRPTAAVLCPWARHFTPRKYWLITQEAMAPSRHDWKIVDWDVKPQHNQPKPLKCAMLPDCTVQKIWTPFR